MLILILALAFTIVLAGMGAFLVRLYLVARNPHGGAIGRGYAGMPESELFGGRRWAIAGCYAALVAVALTLMAVDAVLLFAISVSHS